MSRRRVEKELKEVLKLSESFDDDGVFRVIPTEKHGTWEVTLKGPPDTPYEKGQFELAVSFNRQYPHQPPKIRFVTDIYHMNVSKRGAICLPILIDEWKPEVPMVDIFDAIYQLILEPDPPGSIRDEILPIYITDEDQHNKIASEWTAKYAMKYAAAALESNKKNADDANESKDDLLDGIGSASGGSDDSLASAQNVDNEQKNVQNNEQNGQKNEKNDVQNEQNNEEKDVNKKEIDLNNGNENKLKTLKIISLNNAETSDTSGDAALTDDTKDTTDT